MQQLARDSSAQLRSMEFFLLGPIAVVADGKPVDLGRRRERLLLALLLLDVGKPIHLERLVDLLWDEDLPRDPRGALYTHMSRLRQCLAAHGADRYGVRLVAEAAGYALHADPESVDVHHFTRQVCLASGLDDPAERSAVLSSALALWRGEPLADVVSGLRRERLCAQLAERRRSAIEMRVEADLDLGRDETLIPELAALVAEYPTSERLIAARMLALHRAGRLQDALTAYDAGATHLADQYGLDLSTELTELRTAILRNEPVPVRLRHRPLMPAPRLLPRTITHFTGRAAECEALDQISLGDGSTSPIAIISAITGTAGVGKTALAVHWGRSVEHRFPDGQLYIDLQGYGIGEPVTALAALSLFLRELGVAPEDMPDDESSAVARYRSLLSDAAVLVVLDNAHTVAQVRPLLPPGPRCMTLITSRDLLTGLVALDGARRLPLDVLPREDSLAVLASIIGGPRCAAEPDMAQALTGICSRLPLALRIAGAALAERPMDKIADYVTELATEDRMSCLTIPDDPESSVGRAFGHSYRRLGTDAQRMFRLLGVSPAADIGLPAAAALAGCTEGDALLLLDQLCAAHLLNEPIPGRYAQHDLIADCARELASLGGSSAEIDAALARLTSWYTAQTLHADHVMRPHTTVKASLVSPQVAVPEYPDTAAVYSWFEVEASNLLEMVRYLGVHRPAECCALIPTLSGWLQGQRRHSDWMDIQWTGIRAALLVGDRSEEARMYSGLGDALSGTGRIDDALAAFQRCLDIRRELEAPAEQLTAALTNVGTTLTVLERPADSLIALEEALTIAQCHDLSSLVVGLVNNIGVTYATMGKPAKARAYFRQALNLAGADGEGRRKVSASGKLTDSLAGLGRYDEAAALLENALELANRMAAMLSSRRVHGLKG